MATPSRRATSVQRRPTPPFCSYATSGEYEASSTVGRASSSTAPAPSSSSTPASTASGTTSSISVTRSRTRSTAVSEAGSAPREPAHIRTRVPPDPLPSAGAATTTRWPARSSAHSRCARGEADATRAATPASVASRPRAGQVLLVVQTGSPGRGGGVRPRMRRPSPPSRRPRRPTTPATSVAPVPSTTERRRTCRFRSPTSATASGGSPCSPSSRSRASSRSRSRAHSAGSQPAAARAAVWAARSRRRTSRSASTGGGGRHPEQVGDPARVQAPHRGGGEHGTLQRGCAAHHRQQRDDDDVVRLGRRGSRGRAAPGVTVARPRRGVVAGRGEGAGEHGAAGGGARHPLVEQVAPLPVQVGQRVGRDPAGGRPVEDDQAAPPARARPTARSTKSRKSSSAVTVIRTRSARWATGRGGRGRRGEPRCRSGARPRCDARGGTPPRRRR